MKGIKLSLKIGQTIHFYLGTIGTQISILPHISLSHFNRRIHETNHVFNWN